MAYPAAMSDELLAQLFRHGRLVRIKVAGGSGTEGRDGVNDGDEERHCHDGQLCLHVLHRGHLLSFISSLS